MGIFLHMDLNSIGREAHEINADNGWEVFTKESWPVYPEGRGPERDEWKGKVRFISTHMALIHSEVSEATEAIRHHDRDNFDEELADVIIRVASIAYGLGTDLESAIIAKLAKNKTRGLRHGGKAV